MQSTGLSRFQKGRHNVPVCIKVMRKWIFKENAGQGDPLFVGLVLADAQGGAMYAEINQDIIPTLEPLFQLNGTYVIRKFKVTNAKATYKPFEAQLMIQLSEYTDVKEAENPPQTFPRYIYSITPFGNIKPVKGAVQTFTDVIGYIVKVTGLICVTPKGHERAKILREVYIKDNTDADLKVTLWGEHATEFTIDNVYDDATQKVVVILFVGCLPRAGFGPLESKDKPYLSSGTAYGYYFNPEIKEAQQFYDRFKDQRVYIERPPPEETIPTPDQQITPLDHKTIKELNDIDDPFNFPEKGAKCTVTVTHIPDNNSWWYLSCEPCKKKLDLEPGGGYRCPKCKKNTTPVPRYSLSFRAKDNTGEANFFAFDEAAASIIGKECKAVLNPLKIPDGLPQKLQEVISKKFTFSVTITDDSYDKRDWRQYLVNAILERSDRRGSPLNMPGMEATGQSISLGSSLSPRIFSSLNTPQAPNMGQNQSINQSEMMSVTAQQTLATGTPLSKEPPAEVRRKLFTAENDDTLVTTTNKEAGTQIELEQGNEDHLSPLQEPKRKRRKGDSSAEVGDTASPH